MTSMLSGCLLKPATGFAGSSMIMASSRGFGWASALQSVDQAGYTAQMHCLTMQCLAPLLWPDVEEVAWPALQLHTLQPHSMLCLSWYFLTVWQTVQLPLKHIQRWGLCGCWAIGGFLHPHLSLHSIWGMQLGLSTALQPSMLFGILYQLSVSMS